MVPSSRFGIAAVRTSLQPNFRAGFICAQCRRRASTAIPKAASSAPKPFPPRRYASSSFADNFTDKLRKKIWGTDTPPGQEDPYGPPSLLDQKRRQAEERESDEESEKAAKVPVTTEEPEEDPNYVPATTWDGLDTVGGPNWGMDVWDEENPFEGFVYQSKNDAGQERELIWSKRFMEPVKLGSREEVVAAVHRALVEVWTLKQSGMPLAMDTNPRDPTDDYEYRIASDVRFEKGADGDMALVYATEALQQEIIESIAPKNAVVKEAEEFEVGDVEEEMEDDVLGSSEGVRESSAEAIAPEEMRSERALEMDNMDDTSTEDVEKLENDLDMDPEPPTPVDQGWHEVPFGNADLKFAVLKRVMQLTGRRVPDPDIENITTPKSLVVHLVKKPKPKKLAENLMTSNKVADLPNVQILDRRYTPIDREKEVGRWKIIEEELEARGLPVTGRT